MVLVISSMIHELFISVLFNSQLLEDFPVISHTDFYFDSSKFKNILCIILIILNVLKFVLWPEVSCRYWFNTAG